MITPISAPAESASARAHARVRVRARVAAPTINAYDEYGVPKSGNVGRFQYTGQIWLSELGLYYYKARLYSPYLGRFLQTDPVGYKDQINLYAYVGDDPVNAADPSGESGECGGGLASGASGSSDCPNAPHAGFQQAGGIKAGTQLAMNDTRQQGRQQPTNHSVLTDTQIANIVFNETRSLSGEGIEEARLNVAHAVINGDQARGADRPITADTTATVPASERAAYDSSRRAVSFARIDQKVGLDPTRGAMHLNLRGNASTAPFMGVYPVTTHVGPFQNSFPTTGSQGLPATGVYVNTYGEVERR